MKQRITLTHSLLLGASSLYLGACNEAHHQVNGSEGALAAECAETGDSLPGDAWICPAKKSVECGVDPGTLYVMNSGETDCAGDDLSVSSTGPFSVGTHSVTVKASDGRAVCSAELDVVDTGKPVITAKPVVLLWPPNHKFHSIAVEDCVSVQDACEPTLQGEFIWASSDEPVDDKGDGHFAPDIMIDDCGHVSVRSERQGPKDGRVYKLGVRVVDSAGNATESECLVVVDHDQRGVEGADSGESYRITFDGTQGTPVCDGASDTPPAGDGDGDGDGDSAGDGDGSDTPADAGTPVEPPSDDAGAVPSPL